ncbi:hypothetical protein QQ054_32880 [Oscillatoria amoena NRMC-F 0135]|nr:hypothetical protein [Oscillatoria amoena NRMC-F 0135]
MGEQKIEKAGWREKSGDMPEIEPTEGTESDFEGAGPVHATVNRVIRHPIGEQALDQGVVALGGQQREFLMAVPVPDSLVIASAGSVQIGDEAEIGKGAFDAAMGIPPPVHRGLRDSKG